MAHRLTIAGGSAAVAFTARALQQVHRWSGGIPRLINLICDRALLAGFSAGANRITPEMVTHAAQSLDVQSPSAPRLARLPVWLRRAPLVAAAIVVLLSSTLAVGATAYLYQRFASGVAHANATPARVAPVGPPAPVAPVSFGAGRRLPSDAALTILVGSYSLADPAAAEDIRAMTEWLEAGGFHVFYAEVDLGTRGRWQRILAGAYTDHEAALREVSRLKAAAPASEPRLVSAGYATGVVLALSREPDAARRDGMEP